MLLLFCLIALVVADPLYASYNVGDTDIEYLRNNGCYRGTYGFHKLSLFTCPVEHLGLAPFIDNLDNNLLCVIEIRYREKAIEIASAADDAEIIWAGKHELIVASNDRSATDYPSVCDSVSEYKGSAYNVIRVPRRPFAPLRPFKPTKVNGPDPTIQNLIDAISADSLSKFDNDLAAFFTRNSLSSEAKEAVLSIEESFKLYGFQTSTQSFRVGYCNNVIAERLGATYPTKIVVLGAHADSRSTGNYNVSQRAPGADDNGSGTSALLEIARVIQALGVKFDYTIRLVTFCGEEQGLLGSEALANEWAATGVDVIAMYNADMIGYNCGGKGTVPNLGMMRGSVSQDLTNECVGIIGSYLTNSDIIVGNTTACCSDQQSFYAAGYLSVGIFECPGRNVVYPDYHKSTDLPDRLDFDQVATFTRAILTCAATKAQPIQPISPQ